MKHAVLRVRSQLQTWRQNECLSLQNGTFFRATRYV